MPKTAGVSPGQPISPSSPTVVASPVPFHTGSPADISGGVILFHRAGPDDVERYFTIKNDGTGETALYEAQGCGCAHLSADGTQVLSIGPTGRGTWSLMKLDLDGSDKVVVDPPIETLNLFIGASSSDGRVLAFEGLDETIPANSGLWVASPRSWTRGR